MKKANNLVLLFFLLIPISSIGQPSIGNQGFEVIKEAYRYDKNLPLNAETKETKTFDGYTREKFYFTGVNERVGAYLATPTQGTKPFPVVLLIDGMGGSKERWFLSDNWPNGQKTVDALIAKGFAVFTIDAAMHGERFKEDGLFPKPLSLRKENLMHTVRDLIKLTVQDYMRGIDFLETRDDIDTNKVGVYGLSMGGEVAFILTGLEKRIKVAVTGVAVVYGNENSITNAYNFAPRITNKPFLMLMGDNDGYYTPEMATQLFSSIGGDQNQLIIFEGRHKIPLSFVPTVADWFEKKLH